MDSKGSGNKYQSVNSLMFEWEIENNDIERIPFAEVPVGNGKNGTEIEMVFPKKYYEKYDTFKIEESGQQCIVVTRPIRLADDRWKVCVRLVDHSFDTELFIDACQIGMTTRWISNYMPELHEEGKYLTNALFRFIFFEVKN